MDTTTIAAAIDDADAATARVIKRGTTRDGTAVELITSELHPYGLWLDDNGVDYCDEEVKETR